MKKSVLLRILVFLGVALVLFALVYFAFIQVVPDVWPVLKSGNEADIEAYLRNNTSVGGMICTGLLQFVQVISILLPGAPIQIAAGIVYGTLRGFLLCFAAYLAANVAVFYAARKFNAKLNQLLPIQEGKLMSRARLLGDTDMPVYMTAMACIIPLLPNGIIPYAAAKTKMSLKQFTLAVALGCCLPIFFMCAAGGRILAGDYFLVIAIFVLMLLLVVVLTVFRNQVMNLVRRISRWLHTGMLLLISLLK